VASSAGPRAAADLRPPAVAGRFYPADPRELSADVARFIGDTSHARPRLGIVAPHAGYVYSGPVAGKVYAATRVPDRVCVLAPNHTGRGAPAAVFPAGALDLPGGPVPVDEELTAALIGRAGLQADRDAHRHEHALEVQLPFLRALNPRVRVTPIILGGIDYDWCAAVGRTLAEVAPADLLVVASSDMNHYLPDAETRVRDRRALEPLLKLDAHALYDRVRDEDHSMCGILPATAMLAFANARGAKEATLVAYATSGDAFGDRDRVVGYAGVVVD
jgi:AmmeMemoRadiSam system protein B